MNKEKIKAARINPDSEYSLLSLTKILGKEIKDIHVMVDDYLCIGEPVISVHRLVFTDNTALWFEGEHDYAYLDQGYDVGGLTGMEVSEQVIEDYYEYEENDDE